MKALKRSVMSVLVLSLFLFVVPVFAVLDDDVDQNITTEVKPVSATQVEQPGSAKNKEKSPSTEKTKELSEASKPLNICNEHQTRCSIIISFLFLFTCKYFIKQSCISFNNSLVPTI